MSRPSIPLSLSLSLISLASLGFVGVMGVISAQSFALDVSTTLSSLYLRLAISTHDSSTGSGKVGEVGEPGAGAVHSLCLRLASSAQDSVTGVLDTLEVGNYRGYIGIYGGWGRKLPLCHPKILQDYERRQRKELYIYTQKIFSESERHTMAGSDHDLPHPYGVARSCEEIETCRISRLKFWANQSGSVGGVGFLSGGEVYEVLWSADYSDSRIVGFWGEDGRRGYFDGYWFGKEREKGPWYLAPHELDLTFHQRS